MADPSTVTPNIDEYLELLRPLGRREKLTLISRLSEELAAGDETEAEERSSLSGPSDLIEPVEQSSLRIEDILKTLEENTSVSARAPGKKPIFIPKWHGEETAGERRFSMSGTWDGEETAEELIEKIRAARSPNREAPIL